LPSQENQYRASESPRACCPLYFSSSALINAPVLGVSPRIHRQIHGGLDGSRSGEISTPP
ncbi:hypothetical protein AVEN_123910-1, partial [Araneus ventricosus]